MRVDMEQVSVNFGGLLRVRTSFLRSIRFRFGSTAYSHDELEGTTIGTTIAKTIDNDQVDARLELDHVLANGFNGVIGVQMDQRAIALAGHGASMPGSSTDKTNPCSCWSD